MCRGARQSGSTETALNPSPNVTLEREREIYGLPERLVIMALRLRLLAPILQNPEQSNSYNQN